MADSWIARGLTKVEDNAESQGQPGDTWLTRAMTGSIDREQKRKRQEAAEAKVAAQRKEGTTGQLVSDLAYDVARGTPIGSYLDEGLAAFEAATGGSSYEDALAYQRAANRAIDRASPVLIKDAPLIGDITAGGVAKLTGGVAGGLGVAGAVGRAGAMGRSLVAPGTTPLRSAAKISASGGAGGAFYGYGEGESVEERGQNAALGGVVGMVAAPVMAGAVNAGVRGVQAARNLLTPTPQAVRGYEPEAVKRVGRAVASDDAGSMAQRLPQRRLGDERMVVDSGPNVRAVGEALVAKPGAGKAVMERALRDRDARAPGRLTAAADRALGQTSKTITFGNITKTFDDFRGTVEGAKELSEQVYEPAYRQFANVPLSLSHRTSSLIQKIDDAFPGLRDNVTKALQNDPNMTPQKLQNQGVVLDGMRKVLSDIGYGKAPSDRPLTRLEQRNAKTYAKMLNSAIDAEVSRAGAKDVYKTARSVWKMAKDFEEGAEEGLALLAKRDVTASDVAALFAKGSRETNQGRQLGIREYLRRQMATAQSVYGQQGADRAGVGKALRGLSSRENREKLLAARFGGKEVQELLRGANAEGRFLSTSGNIMGGSPTARREAAKELVPGYGDTKIDVRQNRQATATGIQLEAATRLTNFLLDAERSARNENIARDMARMLITQGADADKLIQSLVGISRRQDLDRAQRQQIGRLVRWIAGATDANVVGQAEAESARSTPTPVTVTRGDVRRNNPNALSR